MKPFLYQVASLFYEKWGAEVSRLAFVFPNRRTGLFFQKYLSEVADIPLFSPTILTINDLFIQLSGKQSADRISMLFTLYDIYIRQSGSTETFDEFLYWGEMLLNDFDDIDKYMANARMLFSNVTDLREIENDFDFLSDEQIAAIRSFWSSFYPRGDTPNHLPGGRGKHGTGRVSGFTLRANCLCRFERLVRIGRTFLSPVAEAEDSGFLLGLCIR